MKLSEFRKLIREEVRKVIKEVGDSSAGPHPVNNLNPVIAKLKKQIAQGEKVVFTGRVKDNAAGIISFTTDEGVKKTMYVGLNYNKKINGFTMEVFLQNANREPEAGKGNLYKLMATIASACKNVTDAIPEIKELKFESYPQWSREDAPDDTAAMKFILSYVKKIYGNVGVRNYYGDVYVKLLDKTA